MKPALRALAFVLQFATIGLAAAFVITRLWPGAVDHLRGESSQPPAVEAPVSSLQPASPRAAGPVSYADAVAKAAPAVVNIYANKVITEQKRLVYPDPVTQKLLGVSVGPAYQRRQQSLGSGVIVSADGYVLTNNHVIARSNDIQVLLFDGRVASAQLVGGDEDTDLAVLRINATDLPTMKLTDSPVPLVGDVVLAIGNPFGFGKTVTMGVVSAVDRQLNQWTYEDFIQTDAAINVGNSGGALINAYGDLVGINTANLPQQYGAEGIGFAIPVATAKTVLDQIIAKGIVVRGWIDIEYGRVSIAANSGLPSAARGAQVFDVYPQSPGAEAGLQPGDIVLKFNDVELIDAVDLRKREAAAAPDTKVRVAGLRAGIPFDVELTLMQRPVLNRQQPQNP